MGTNPKRTVTVQMVPQLAAVDALGNKEPNANWAKEPDLAPPTNNTIPQHPQNTTTSKESEPIGCDFSDEPVPANGNRIRPEPAKVEDQRAKDLSVDRSVDEGAGGDGTDANANVTALKPAEQKRISGVDVSPLHSESKVDVHTNGCRVKCPSAEEESARTASAAREDDNKNVSPDNTNLNDKCELRHPMASEPQQDNTGSNTSAPVNKDSAALPQTSQEPDHLGNLVILQETPKPEPKCETMVTLPGSTTSPFKSKEAEVSFTNEDSSCTRPEKDLPPVNKPQVSSDECQPMTGSPTLPQATSVNMAAGGLVVDKEDAIRISATVAGPSKLYSEVSTMTSSLSSTPVKQCHDMEVQAVANTCSIAVATSPSLLPFAAATRNLNVAAAAPPREEPQSLAAVYQVDGSVGLHQTNSASAPSSASTDPRLDRLTVEAEVCPGKQGTGAGLQHSAEVTGDRSLGAKPKDQAGSVALCNTQPVYQININHKEPAEKGTSQTSVAKQTADKADAPSVKSGAPLENNTKPGSADSKNTVLSQAAAPTTKAKQAPSAAATTTTQANTTSMTSAAKNKAGSPREKPKARGKAQTKEAKKKNVEPEREDEEEDNDKGKNVHDVVWDEQGMTWEVYGASVDPESLGFAIQSHLQCKIKEQERKLIARTSIRKSVTAAVESPQATRKNKRRDQNIFRSWLQNVRRPNCCARPPPSSVLE